MPTEPGPRVERHEAEGLRLGHFDDLPDVDAHPVEDDLQLVDEGDVHRPEDVLEELGAFGHLGAGHGDHGIHRGAVEGAGDFLGGRVDAADDLRDVPGVELRIAGVLALGRERQEVALASRQPSCVEAGLQLLAGGSGVSGGLQDDQLAGTEAASDLVRRASDVGEVRVAMPAEGRGDADEDGVALGQSVEVRRGLDAAASEGIGHALRADVPDVGLAAVKRLGLLRVDVEAEDGEAGFLEEEGEREADVPEADDADGGGAGADSIEEMLFVDQVFTWG